MKKNIIRITETELKQMVKQMVNESVRRILKEDDDDRYFGDYFDDPDDEPLDDEEYEERKFSIHEKGYNIKTGKIEDLTGMPYNDDTFEDLDEVYKTMKHMLTYPEWSSEYDTRYANDRVLLLSVADEDGLIDEKTYMSSIDAQYKDDIQAKLPDRQVVVIRVKRNQ